MAWSMRNLASARREMRLTLYFSGCFVAGRGEDGPGGRKTRENTARRGVIFDVDNLKPLADAAAWAAEALLWPAGLGGRRIGFGRGRRCV